MNRNVEILTPTTIIYHFSISTVGPSAARHDHLAWSEDSPFVLDMIPVHRQILSLFFTNRIRSLEPTLMILEVGFTGQQQELLSWKCLFLRYLPSGISSGPVTKIIFFLWYPLLYNTLLRIFLSLLYLLYFKLQSVKIGKKVGKSMMFS